MLELPRRRTLLALATTPLLGLSDVRNAHAAAGPSWASGFGNLDFGREYERLVDDQANYLRRKTGVFTSFFVRRGSLAEANAYLPEKARLWRQLTDAGIRIVQVVSLVFDNDGANIQRILNPSDSLHVGYVSFWRRLAQGMRSAGATAPIVRIGHEMNIKGSYQWSYENPKLRAADFVRLYRLAAATIRKELPGAVRCWNPGKRTVRGHIDELWPGNAYVDLVGLDFYDNGVGGYVVDEAAWNRLANKIDSTGPVGVYPWYAYAKARGKRFAVPEWGITDPKVSGIPTDRPVFIRKMHEFFSYVAVRGDLVFESYYNYAYTGIDKHQLYPVLAKHRQSSRVYQQLFGAR
jgi:hypothetical protein